MANSALLEVLACARQIATHAQRLGIDLEPVPSRPMAGHLGAVLADSVLQAGLNYRTVVKPRVDRIQLSYPEAANLTGLKKIVDGGGTADFLAWKHSTKIARFNDLVSHFYDRRIENTFDLRSWLTLSDSRNCLLEIRGIGPKTYDYMCCLVGIDHIAIDRHVKVFAIEAGVPVHGYNDLQAIVSYAADLLDVPRRDFDAWIWQQQAQSSDMPCQLKLI